jgi:kynurenine formamidase
MSDHAGTHVDAFKHFGPGGESIDEMPLDDFYTSAIALDLSHVELGASISAAEMEEALEASGEEIKQGDTVLVHMGFNKRVHFDEPRWQHCFPGLHPESVEWLAGRGCGMFGEFSIFLSLLLLRFHLYSLSDLLWDDFFGGSDGFFRRRRSNQP